MTTIQERGYAIVARLGEIEMFQPERHAAIVRQWNLTAPLVVVMRAGHVAALTAEAKADLDAFEAMLAPIVAECHELRNARVALHEKARVDVGFERMVLRAAHRFDGSATSTFAATLVLARAGWTARDVYRMNS